MSEKQALIDLLKRLAEDQAAMKDIEPPASVSDSVDVDLKTLAAMVRTLEYRINLSKHRLNTLERIAWVLLTALAGYLGKTQSI